MTSSTKVSHLTFKCSLQYNFHSANLFGQAQMSNIASKSMINSYKNRKASVSEIIARDARLRHLYPNSKAKVASLGYCYIRKL